MKTYPDAPGFKVGDTSEQAAKAVESKASTLRARCLAVLRAGDRTADEVAAQLGETVLAVRPRISELFKNGLVRRSQARRSNESGCSAVVWTAKFEAQPDLL